MPYVRVWVHCVWGTKSRLPFLFAANKINILNHIRENAKKKGVYIDYINGAKDHIHCLISLSMDVTLSKTIQLIKGESSYWINRNEFYKGTFEWADEYYAVSVSESQLDKVRDYIRKQEEHHRNRTWEEECELFMKKYNFKKIFG